MQKFVDQTISANTNYDPSKFEDGKLPLQKMIQDILTTYKLGIKTLYYHNTRDGSTDAQAEKEVEAEQKVVETTEEISTNEYEENTDSTTSDKYVVCSRNVRSNTIKWRIWWIGKIKILSGSICPLLLH